jgi:hypothetical protein
MKKTPKYDLFEHFELMPDKLKEIIDNHYDEYGEGDYNTTEALLKKVEEIGYTFDYGLDNSPYGLRPIGTNLNELEGFEEF